MRVLVCGGRNYDERDLVWRTLDQYQEYHGPLTVIQGGASGAIAGHANGPTDSPPLRKSHLSACRRLRSLYRENMRLRRL
jgi:hypothetical protein